MADYDSGLPIRTEADGTDERVQVKIVDKDNPDTQQATVDTDNNVKVGVYGDRADDAADVALLLSEEGRPNGRGDYEINENSKPASSAIIAHERDAAKDETHQNQRVSAIASTVDTDVTALDVAIRDEQGNPFTSNNPMPVAVSESEGTEVYDYNTSATVASDASTNHDYTVTTAQKLIIDEILCSASGRARFELQIEDGVAAGTFTAQAVIFNSTAKPTETIPVKRRLTVAAGVIVRIVCTNRDNQPQDLYTTLMGVEDTP